MKLLQRFLKWFKRESEKPKVVEQSVLTVRRHQKIHFQVGLDFGTSFTKIAYSQLGGRGKRVRPIRFDHRLPHCPPYCLPSVAAFDNSGKLLLGVEAVRHLADKHWDAGLRRFKVLVAGKYDASFRDEDSANSYRNYVEHTLGSQKKCEPEHLTVAYLAFAMRQARLAIQREFADYELDIAFNICIPIDHIQNNPVRNAFEKIFATAEAIESKWDGSKPNDLLKLSKRKYEKCKYLPDNPKTRVFPVPEAVAETASYLASLQVRNGLHVVIDFGAGTTDFSIFNLCHVRTASPKQYWYSARNLPKGAQKIEQVVAEYLQSQSTEVNETQIAQALEDIDKKPKPLQGNIKRELRSLREDSRQVWGEAYGHLKKQSEWEKGKVQIFICGGGSKLPYIKEIFYKSPIVPDWGPHPLSTLPVPNDYDSFNNQVPFERLSVAYGLTYTLPELREFDLPADSPDHTPPPLPVWKPEPLY